MRLDARCALALGRAYLPRPRSSPRIPIAVRHARAVKRQPTVGELTDNIFFLVAYKNFFGRAYSSSVSQTVVQDEGPRVDPLSPEADQIKKSYLQN